MGNNAPPIHLGAWSMAVAAFCISVCVCTGSKTPQLCVKLMASITRLMQSWRVLGFFPPHTACRLIRPSVDGLYRDGTVHISREMHKQCFLTRRETTSRAPKHHRHRSRTFL